MSRDPLLTTAQVAERKLLCWFCERAMCINGLTGTMRYHLYPVGQEERPPLLVHGERCPGSGQYCRPEATQ